MENNKKRIIYVLILLLFFITFMVLSVLSKENKELKKDIENINEYLVTNSDDKYNRFDYSWIGENKTVAHALGSASSSNGKPYSNSLNAFEKNYGLGQRVFECDFDITNDYVTVCSHDEDFWRFNANISDDTAFIYDNFMNSKIYEKYQPLDYKGIIDLLNKYEDAYIITDTKYFNKENVYLQFSQIVNYAKKINPSILDRIIPQIYNEEMFDYVMNIYPFKSIVYTLYQTAWEKEEVADFCVETGIKFVTISNDILDDETLMYWNAYGINVAIHTVNDENIAKERINQGVKMIYTDELLTSQLGVE